jgi:predicted nucleic acid-binding protein
LTIPRLLLLDTNILIHLVRENRTGRSIDFRFQLRSRLIVDISDEVLELYAQIDTHLRRNGKAVEQNDVWIAATAIASRAHLLTTDKDFDPLYPLYLDRTWIDPQRPDA